LKNSTILPSAIVMDWRNAFSSVGSSTKLIEIGAIEPADFSNYVAKNTGTSSTLTLKKLLIQAGKFNGRARTRSRQCIAERYGTLASLYGYSCRADGGFDSSCSSG
jgi:hypothetical protein